jgi:hypothetical protein
MSASVAGQIRRLTAIDIQKSHVLPAAAASVGTSSINFETTTLGPAADDIEATISIEATPSLVDDKTIILTVEDSADDSTFAAIAGIGTLTVTGASSAGAATASQRFKFPPATRQYVRVSAAVLTGGGSNIAKSFYLKVFPNS